jgi:D-alanyl-D-alanine carboxypeptidase
VLVVREGDRTVRIARGRARVTPARALRVTDRFRVGSVTKPFVATVVLQLAAEGRLSLDDSVERWVPGAVPGGAGISVRQLLNMTSGLFDYLNDGDDTVAKAVEHDPTRRWSPAELIGISTAHPVLFAPGASWSYCNTCYILLGLIAEKASGQPIATALQQRVIGPLGLRRTSFDSVPAIAGRHAHGYERSGRTLTDVTELNPTVAFSAGALVSTADDLATFLRGLVTGRLLPPASLQAMRTTVSMGEEGSDYGLGLFSTETPCGRAEGHDGGIPGYRTLALTRPDGRRQAVLIANLGEDSFTGKVMRAYYDALGVGLCGS